MKYARLFSKNVNIPISGREGNLKMELGKQKDQFRISVESKVDNPLGTTESFNKQFQSGGKEREAVK